ncbi:MAG: protein kinase [Candidatus Anammoximicrobium sp.]|nr:protein kinase [Candidatus Anammoximicrobium sp.]
MPEFAEEHPPAQGKPARKGKPTGQFSLESSLSLLCRIAGDRAGDQRTIQEPADAKTLPKSKLRGLRREALALLPKDLYTHQVKAIQSGLDGKNVVVATATASGKSLCYQALAAHLLAESPDSTVLYLAPINALVMDQLDALEGFFAGKAAERRAANELGAYLRSCSSRSLQCPLARYDGAVPKKFRPPTRAARPRFLLSNPEMLVQAILPRAHKEKGPELQEEMWGKLDSWAYLFRGLRLVVIDELHAYRGVFGAHLANVLRRVRRMVHLCGGDSSKVQFFACSATIQDPQDLAKKIFGAPATVIAEDENGMKRHRRVLLPITSDDERLHSFATRILGPLAFEGGARTIAFRDNIPALFFMQKAMAKTHGSGNVVVYAAAQPSGEKLPRLYEVKSGRVPLLLATCALELGIDVGALDAAVLLGYPGSIAKTWQMLGRAGRKSDGLLVYVAGNNYLDQYWYEHIDELVGEKAEPEEIIVEPDNVYVVQEHLRGAALDHVLDEKRDAKFFGPAFKEAFDKLQNDEEGIYRFEKEVWILRASGEKRAREISLRSLGQYKVPVYLDEPETRRRLHDHNDEGLRTLLEEQSDRAPKRLFIGAQFLWEEKYYRVTELHIPEPVTRGPSQDKRDKAYALVSIMETPEYLTQAAAVIDPHILTIEDAAVGVEQGSAWGNVEVRQTVDGYYQQRDIIDELEKGGRSGEKPKYVPLGQNAPPHYAYRTQGTWLSVPIEVAEVVPDNLLSVTLQTVAEALVRAAPLLRFVSPGDLTWSIKWPGKADGEGADVPLQGRPLIHLNETVLGGAGLAGRLFQRRRELMTAARKLLDDCPRCGAPRAKSNGCPRCVALLSGRQNRRAAILMLDAWLGLLGERKPRRKTEEPKVSNAEVLRNLGYTDVESIGVGAMGQVWKGHKAGEFVAVKLIREGRGKATEGAHVEALAREASCLERLQHPNIVRLRRLHQFSGGIALELDWADGGDLYDHVEANRTIKEKLQVYRKIVAAVAYLHDNDVVHRDLKDSNILFRAGEPLVADFGIARILREERATTRMAGTEGWAAPEQLDGRRRRVPVAKTMDVWALGKVLGFLFTKSVDSLKRDQSHAFPEEIPARFHRVLTRCLAGDPKRRYADAGELLAAVDDALSTGRGRS